MGKMTLQEARNKIKNLKLTLKERINGDGIVINASTREIQKEILELCELQKIVDSGVNEFEYSDVTQKVDRRSAYMGDTVLPYNSLNKVIKDIIGQEKTEYDSISRVNELVDYYNREGLPGDYQAKVFYEKHLPFGEGNLREKQEFINLYRVNEAIRFANPGKAKTLDELRTLLIEGRNKQSIKEKREQAYLERELSHNPLENAPTKEYGENINKYNIDLTKNSNIEKIKLEKAKVMLNDESPEAQAFRRDFYVELINKMLDLPDHKLYLSNSNEADKYYQEHIREINALLEIENLFGGPQLNGGLINDLELDDEIIDVLKHKSELAKTYIAKSKNNILMRSDDPVSYELLDSLTDEERELALNNMVILPNRVKDNRFEYLESKKNIENEINDLPKPSYSMDGYHVNPNRVFVFGQSKRYQTLDSKIQELNDLDLSKSMTRKMANFRDAILACNRNIKRNDISNNLLTQSYLELKTAATLFADTLTEKERRKEEGQEVINYIDNLKAFIDKTVALENMKSNIEMYEANENISRTKMDDIVEACDMYFDIDTALSNVEFNGDVTEEEQRMLKGSLRNLTSKLFEARSPYTPLKSYFGVGNISIGIGDEFVPKLMTAFGVYKNLPRNFMLDKINPNSSLYSELTRFYNLLENVKNLSQDEINGLLKEHTTKTFLKNIGNIKYDLKELGYKQNIPDNVLVEKLKESFERNKKEFFGDTYDAAIKAFAYENRTVGEELEYQESILRRYIDKDIPSDKRVNVVEAIAKMVVLKEFNENEVLPNSSEINNKVKEYLKNNMDIVNNIQMNGSDAIKEYFNNPESIKNFEFKPEELSEPNLTLAYRELREKLGEKVDVSNLPEDFVPKELTQVQKDARVYLSNLNKIHLKSNIVKQVGPLYGENPGNGWERLYMFFLKTPYTKEDVLYNTEIIKNIYENKVDENGVPFRKKILLEKLEELKNLDPYELVDVSDEDLVKNFEKIRTTWGIAFAGRQDFASACRSEGIEFSKEEQINMDILNDQATFAYSPLAKRMDALGNPYWQIGTMLNSDQIDLKNAGLKIKYASTILNDVSTNKTYIDAAEERSNIQKAFADSGIHDFENKEGARYLVYDSNEQAKNGTINDVYGALLAGKVFAIRTPSEDHFYQYDMKNHGLVMAGSIQGIKYKLREIDTTLRLENRKYEKAEYLDVVKNLRKTAHNKVVLGAFFTKEDMARVLVLDDIILKLNSVYNDPNADLYFENYVNEDFIQDSVNQLVKEERFTDFVKDYIGSDTIPDNIAVYTDKEYFGYDAQTGEFFTANDQKIQENRVRKYETEIPTNVGHTPSNVEVLDSLYTAHSELYDKIVNLREASNLDVARLIIYQSLRNEIENATDQTFDQTISKINEAEIKRRIDSMVETRPFKALIDKIGGGIKENGLLNRVPLRYDLTNVFNTYQAMENSVLDNNIEPWNERLTEETTLREIENTKKLMQVDLDKISYHDTIPGSYSSEARLNLLKIGFLKYNLNSNLGYSLKEIEDLAYKYENDSDLTEIRNSILKKVSLNNISSKVVAGNQEGKAWEDRIAGLLDYYDKKEKGEIKTPDEYLEEIKKTQIVSEEEEKEFKALCAINNGVRYANPSKAKSLDEIWNVQHDLELKNLHEESIEDLKKMNDATFEEQKISSRSCFLRSYRYNFDKSFPINERIKLEKAKVLLNGNSKEALEFQREFLAEMLNKVISIPEDDLALRNSKEAKDFLVNNSNNLLMLFEIENIMKEAKDYFEIPKEIVDVIKHKKDICQQHLQNTYSALKLRAHKEYKVSKLFEELETTEITIAQAAEGEFEIPRDVKNALAELQIEKFSKAETTEKVEIDYSTDNHYLNVNDIRIKVIPTPEKTIKDLNNRFKSEIDKVELRENESFSLFRETLDISNNTIRVAETLEHNKFIYDNLLKRANAYISSMKGKANLTADETNAIDFAKEVKTFCDSKSKLFACKLEIAKIEKEFGAETNVIDRIIDGGQNGYQLSSAIQALKDQNQNPLVDNKVSSLLRDAAVIYNNVELNDKVAFGKNNVANFYNSNLSNYLLGLHNSAKAITINELNKLKGNPELFDAVKTVYNNALKLPDNIEGINELIENRSRLSILSNLTRIKEEFKKYGYKKEISDNDLVNLIQDKIKSYEAVNSPIEKSVKEIVYSDRTIKEELEFRKNRIRTYGNRELKDNEWVDLARDVAFVLRYKDEMDGPLGGLNNMEESISSYIFNHKELMINMLNHDKETINKAIEDPTKLLEDAVIKEKEKELPNIAENYQIALECLRGNGINTENMNQAYTDVPFDDVKKEIIKIESKYDGIDPAKGNKLFHEIEDMVGKKGPISFGRISYHFLKPITSEENLKYDIDMIYNIAYNPIGKNGVPFRKQLLLDTWEKIKGINFNKYMNISNEDMLENIEEIKGLGGLALMATGSFMTACQKEGIQFTDEDIQELGIIEAKAMSILGPLKEVIVAKGSPNEYIYDQLNLSKEQFDRIEDEPSFENKFFQNSRRAKDEKAHYDEFCKALAGASECGIENIPNKAECKVEVYTGDIEEEVDFKKGYNKLIDGEIISVSEKINNPIQNQGEQGPVYKEPVFYKFDPSFGTVITSNSIEGLNKIIDTASLGKFKLELPGNSLYNIEAGYNNSVNNLKQDLINKVKLNERDLATLIVVDAVKKNMDKYKESPDMYETMLNAFVNEEYIEDNVQTIQNSEAFKNYVNELGGTNKNGYINTKLLNNEILNGKAFDKYVSHQNMIDERKNQELAERKEALLKEKVNEYNKLSPEKKNEFLKKEFKLKRDFMEYRKLEKEGAVFEKNLKDKYDLCHDFKLRADSEKLMTFDDPIEMNNFLKEVSSIDGEENKVDNDYIEEVQDKAKDLNKKNRVEKKQELRMEEI